MVVSCSLRANKVVRSGRTTSIREPRSALKPVQTNADKIREMSIPSNPNGLWHLQRSSQCLPIHLIDFVNSQPCPHQYQCWLERLPVRLGYSHEAIFIDIGKIPGRVYAQGCLIRVCQSPKRKYVSLDSSSLLRASCDLETYCMQRAVAEGPNHSPGYLPQATAPWRTKLCNEYGARGSSAKRARIFCSCSTATPRRQSVKPVVSACS